MANIHLIIHRKEQQLLIGVEDPGWL